MANANARLMAADYMQRDIVTVTPDDTLRDALALMTQNRMARRSRVSHWAELI